MNLNRTMVHGRGQRFQVIKLVLVTVGIVGSLMQSVHGALATTRSGLADLRAQGAISVSSSGTSLLRVRVALPKGKTREEFRIWQLIIRPLMKMEFRSSDDEFGIFGVFATNSGRASKYLVEVEINGESINMEVDMAADFSIMSRDTYIKRFKSFPLQDADVKLKTYSGETLRTCGQMLCKLVYSRQEYILLMIVAENKGKPILLGRN